MATLLLCVFIPYEYTTLVYKSLFHTTEILYKIEKIDLIWFGLFNDISTRYGLFNAEIWLICKWLKSWLCFQCSIAIMF